jgi:AcrR family transcriptional regulator
MGTKAKGEQTREQIVRSALRIFAERGFRGTTLDAIASTVGVTRQALVHHFSSKTQLFLAVLDQRERDEREEAKAWAPDVDSLADGMVRLLQYEVENPELAYLFTVLSAESAQLGNPAREYFEERYRRVRTEVAGSVAEEQAQGHIAADLDPQRVAAALLALLDGLHLQHQLEPDLDVVRILSDMLSLLYLTRGIGASNDEGRSPTARGMRSTRTPRTG